MAPVPFRKLSSYAIITEPALPDNQTINRHQPNICQSPRRGPEVANLETSQVEHKSVKARQSEQGDVKEEGIGLLAMPDD